RLVDVGRGRLHQVEVHQSVLVVVYPAEARAHGLEVILLVGRRRVLVEVDSRRSGNVCEAHGCRDRRSWRGLQGWSQRTSKGDRDAANRERRDHKRGRDSRSRSNPPRSAPQRIALLSRAEPLLYPRLAGRLNRCGRLGTVLIYSKWLVALASGKWLAVARHRPLAARHLF